MNRNGTPNRNLLKKLRDDSGQALVTSLLCMTCLFGFAALATDVGILLREKRLAQIAADSAAIAGALELNYSSASVSSAAQAAATQNGFTNGSGGATVTVNSPPSSGPHASTSGYVEVIIQQVQPALLRSLLGLGSITVATRAVAQNGASSYGCVYILAPTGSQAMELQGSFTVSTPNCGVVVDSSDSDALDFTGAGGSLTAGSVGVVGGCGGHCGDSTPAPVTGIAPQSDPLGTMVPPNPASLTCSAPTAASSSSGSAGTLSGNVIVPAGVYTTCYSGTVNLTNATFPAGTFVFTGDVNVSGTLTSAQPPAPIAPSTTSSNPLNGTTLDIDSGTLSAATGTTWSLYAPQAAATSYTNYNGIALMQPSYNTHTMSIQQGNAYGTIDGIIYAPDAQLYLNDSGGDHSGGITLITDLIVGTLYDKTATLTINSYSQATSGSPLTRVTLVE